MREYAYFYFYLLLYAFLLLNTVLLLGRCKPDSPVRLIAAKAAVFFFILFTAFLAAEGYCYYFYDTTDDNLALLSSLRWLDRYGHENDLNFRGKMPPQSVPKGTGEKRICVLGDSFTWGQGIKRIEDRFSDLLEKKLRERGCRTSVYNVSEIGWRTTSELYALRFFQSHDINFDEIILTYTMNDIAEPEDFPPDYIRAWTRLNSPPSWLKPFINRSFSLSFLYRCFIDFHEPILRQHDQIMLKFYRDPDRWRKHLSDLQELRDQCRHLGMEFAVVSLPALRAEADEHEFDGIQRNLNSFWESIGVRNIDLSAELGKYPVKKLVVGRWDANPNELAHRLTAERILAKLFEGKTAEKTD